MSEDLYGLLGISKSASDAEIKSAYRKQARKYHPDVNKEPGAEEKFKKLQKAYTILSDPQRKQQYDQFGVADDSAAGGGAGGFGGFGGGFSSSGFSSSFDGIDDIFDAFFGGSGGRSSSRPTSSSGEDLRYDLQVTLEDVAKGLETEIEIFHLENSGGSSKSCSTCNGTGQIKVTQRTILGVVSQVTTCNRCGGAGGEDTRKKIKKKIRVTIPPGVETGVKLRVKGEGNDSIANGPSGDLYVFIKVKNHAFFKREEENIILSLDLPFTQLVLGCEIEVPILNGNAKLKVPAGTQPGTVFRLKSKGVPNLQGYGRGDQYVEVNAKLPKHLSSKEKKLVEEIQNIRGDKKVYENINEFIVKK
ncbi:MAG: molecular chaperone DnaJ [Rickettsiales bacterium]|nr:molecular chaperone DnaJ [Rickettsiales bacterium]